MHDCFLFGFQVASVACGGGLVDVSCRGANTANQRARLLRQKNCPRNRHPTDLPSSADADVTRPLFLAVAIPPLFR